MNNVVVGEDINDATPLSTLIPAPLKTTIRLRVGNFSNSGKFLYRYSVFMIVYQLYIIKAF